MRCFNHIDRDTVGSCKSCCKGPCTKRAHKTGLRCARSLLFLTSSKPSLSSSSKTVGRIPRDDSLVDFPMESRSAAS
jgi:hypothetical protein